VSYHLNSLIRIQPMNKKILIFFISLILISCKKEIEYGANKFIVNDYEKWEKELFKYSADINDRPMMSDITVRDFVNELKADTTDKDKLDILQTRGKTNINWINENDLEYLISKINSKEKAKCVMGISSSNIPDSKGMTIGNQIISIIESYRNKEPYPREDCECKIYSQNKVDEILAWWKKKNGS
ncbi:hypothetical protein ACFQ1F_08550, partial [Flaviramulus multivorans]|uniref:hypothetical protein n=1 Tax=Flaviramulus multivorans TaxID=1304750 RepID=UPI003630ED04